MSASCTIVCACVNFRCDNSAVAASAYASENLLSVEAAFSASRSASAARPPRSACTPSRYRSRALASCFSAPVPTLALAISAITLSLKIAPVSLCTALAPVLDGAALGGTVAPIIMDAVANRASPPSNTLRIIALPCMIPPRRVALGHVSNTGGKRRGFRRRILSRYDEDSTLNCLFQNGTARQQNFSRALASFLRRSRIKERIFSCPALHPVLHPRAGFCQRAMYSAAFACPGDKSISHRYAMLAALARGTTRPAKLLYRS